MSSEIYTQCVTVANRSIQTVISWNIIKWNFSVHTNSSALYIVITKRCSGKHRQNRKSLSALISPSPRGWTSICFSRLCAYSAALIKINLSNSKDCHSMSNTCSCSTRGRLEGRRQKAGELTTLARKPKTNVLMTNAHAVILIKARADVKSNEGQSLVIEWGLCVCVLILRRYDKDLSLTR